MTLYLYDTATKSTVMTLEQVRSYTDREVVTADGVYAPLAEGLELSSTQDCMETLRAGWRTAHPDMESRTAALESAVLALMMGGMT